MYRHGFRLFPSFKQAGTLRRRSSADCPLEQKLSASGSSLRSDKQSTITIIRRESRGSLDATSNNSVFDDEFFVSITTKGAARFLRHQIRLFSVKTTLRRYNIKRLLTITAVARREIKRMPGAAMPGIFEKSAALYWMKYATPSFSICTVFFFFPKADSHLGILFDPKALLVADPYDALYRHMLLLRKKDREVLFDAGYGARCRRKASSECGFRSSYSLNLEARVLSRLRVL